jgi:opacity protein-like surface antigen
MFLRSIGVSPRKSLVILALLAGAALPAQADGYRWTGISVYAGGGGNQLGGDVGIGDTTKYSAEIDCESVGNTPHALPLFGCKELGPIAATLSNKLGAALNGDAGIFGTVGVGADYQIMPRFVVGAFADIDWSNTDADFSGKAQSSYKIDHLLKITSTTQANGKLDYDYSWTVGGRVGVLSEDRRALLYVLGGYTRLNTSGSAQISNSVDASLEIPFIGSIGAGFDAKPFTVGLPKSFDGATVGIGGEVKLTNFMSLKLEGRYTNLQAQSVTYSAYSSDKKTLAVFEKGCSSSPPSLVDTDCAAVLKTSANSKGVIDVDPEIWSGRAALSFMLN